MHDANTHSVEQQPPLRLAHLDTRALPHFMSDPQHHRPNQHHNPNTPTPQTRHTPSQHRNPQVSRAEYRQQRVQRYRNYMNCIPEDDCPAVRAELIAGWPQPALLRESQWPFPFLRNWRAVASSIVHFQLRNLLWAASAHDVAVVYDNRVQHWNSVTRGVSDVLDLRGWPKGPRLPGLGRVQVRLAGCGLVGWLVGWRVLVVDRAGCGRNV